MQAPVSDFVSVCQVNLAQIEQLNTGRADADVGAAIVHQVSMIRDRLADIQAGRMGRPEAITKINESLYDIGVYNEKGGVVGAPFSVAGQTGACVAGLQWLTANSALN